MLFVLLYQPNLYLILWYETHDSVPLMPIFFVDIFVVWITRTIWEF